MVIKNLCFEVSWKKFKQLFQMVGSVQYVAVWRKKARKSRDMGTVTFEHPRHATWVVAIFNGQTLWGRPLGVKLDRGAALYRDC